jgi:hypothetical protein
VAIEPWKKFRVQLEFLREACMRAKFLGISCVFLVMTLAACSGENPSRPSSVQQSAAAPSTAGTGANQTPVASFTAPSAGATLAGATNAASCSVTAADGDGSIARVEFTLIGRDTRATFAGVKSGAVYSCPFDTKTYPNGDYTLTVRVVDNQGAESEATVAVRIENKAEGPATPGASGCTLSSVDYVVEDFRVMTTPQHGVHRYARIRNLGCEQSFMLANYVARVGTSLDQDNQVLFSSDPALGQPRRYLKTGEVGEFRAAFATCGEHQSDLAWGIDAPVTPQFGANGEHLLRLPAGGNHFSNPVPCAVPVCTVALTATAGYADGVVSIVPAAPGAARPVTLLVSLDGAPNTLLPAAQTGSTSTFAVPQDNRDHTVGITAQLVDTNGALCQTTTSLRIEALRTCTTPLALLATFANNSLSIVPSASLASRPVTLTIAIDGGAPTTVQTTVGAAANVAFTQDGNEHNVAISGVLNDLSGVACVAQTTLRIPPKEGCLTPLNLAASYAGGAMSILPTATGGARPVTLTVAVDGGPATTLPAAQTGVAASHPFAQDGSSHTALITGRLVGLNGAVCQAQTTLTVPPRQATCADIGASLTQTGPPVSTPSQLSVNVSPRWAGTYAATLQLCSGSPITPTSGSTYPVTVARGPTSTTCTMALVVDPNGLNCRAQLPVVVEPCSVVNPPLYRIDTSGIVVSGGIANVSVAATISNYTGLRLGIIMVNTVNARVKASVPVNQACVAGAATVTVNYASERLPSEGNRFFAILFTGSDESPDIARDPSGAELRFEIPVR